jgi:hypothetical protein
MTLPGGTNKRNWFIIGGIVGFVVLLCCAAGLVGGMVWLNRETPERVVDAYLSAVQQGDRPRSERMLCEGLRHGAAGRLTGLAQDWMEVVDWEITDSRDTDKSAEVTARVTVKLSGVATTIPFGFIVIKENGDWRICGFKNHGLNLNPQPTG